MKNRLFVSNHPYEKVHAFLSSNTRKNYQLTESTKRRIENLVRSNRYEINIHISIYATTLVIHHERL